MFLLVRTKDQLKKTEIFFKKTDIDIHTFAISSIIFHKIEIDKHCDGFIVTSPNAILAIPQTKLPFFCVGEATKKEAIDTGRRIAFTGYSGAEDMAIEIARRFPPETLIHAAGDRAEISWYTILENVGIHIEKRLAYETKYTEEFDIETLNTLKDNTLKALVFFSIQGAKTFTLLLKENNLNPENYNVITFSDQISDFCSSYKNTYVSKTPSLQAVKNIMESL